MSMMNSFEHHKIRTNRLPQSWQEDGALDELEHFLQENWQQRSIFYEDGHVTSRQQFIDFDRRDGIKLQNYIGTIAFRGEQLNIFPKVFQYDEDDYDTSSLSLEELLQNLVLWLSYCDRMNFPFVSMKGELSSAENLLELLITLYVNYVKNTMDRHRFYRYEEVTEEGSYVKGKLNVKNYGIRKFPMGQNHRMEYTYSSFVYDNEVNRIIKSTCLLLLTMTKQRGNQNILRRLLMNLGEVTRVHVHPYDCDRLPLSALHQDYRIILSMSKMFLLNQSSTYQMGPSDSFCFLFPAELLFEGFIGGYLKELFHNRGKITTQASGQYLADLVVDGEILGSAFSLREDIVIETGEETIILDTKYKRIDSFDKVKETKKLGVSDNDMKQMAVYAAKRGAKRLYLIYPLGSEEDLETIEIRYDIRLDHGESKRIPLEILKVPFIFGKNVEEDKKRLESVLRKILQ